MQRFVHLSGQTRPRQPKRAEKLFKCFRQCPCSKLHLPVRAETHWPRARGGWCCTFSLPRGGCRQDDFPTLSISTLTGVISSHFPRESFGGLAGAVVLVRSQRGQIISLDCQLLWKWRWHLWLLVCPASLRMMLSALSYQGFQLLSSGSPTQPPVATSPCAHLCLGGKGHAWRYNHTVGGAYEGAEMFGPPSTCIRLQLDTSSGHGYPNGHQ